MQHEPSVKQQIEMLKAQRVAIDEQIQNLLSNCAHELPPMSERLRRWISEQDYQNPEARPLPAMPIKLENELNNHVKCHKCGTKFLSWGCPASPDQTCHYIPVCSNELNDTATFELKDGTYHIEPFDEHYTEDSCIFCHQPEE